MKNKLEDLDIYLEFKNAGCIAHCGLGVFAHHDLYFFSDCSEHKEPMKHMIDNRIYTSTSFLSSAQNSISYFTGLIEEKTKNNINSSSDISALEI